MHLEDRSIASSRLLVVDVTLSQHLQARLCRSYERLAHVAKVGHNLGEGEAVDPMAELEARMKSDPKLAEFMRLMGGKAAGVGAAKKNFWSNDDERVAGAAPVKGSKGLPIETAKERKAREARFSTDLADAK